jgi:2-haloacid dehalogenase
MKLADFNVLSFDCYGTLIDWETGIERVLAPLLGRVAQPISREAALEAFAAHELAQQEKTPQMIYSTLLTEVYKQLADQWKVAVTQEEAERFGASVPSWPAFPDSTPALSYLKQHYKLVILSNVDRLSFKGSNALLQVEFDAIYTAQDIGSYKPSLRNFDYLLEKLGGLGYTKKDILHTAQSLFHDHVPANKLGIASAWIDRRHAQKGWGATLPPAEQVSFDFRFDSLADFVRAHELELREKPSA